MSPFVANHSCYSSYLVQNSGRVLGKDELVAAIWPDVTVSDNSLTQCMKDIRKALGPEGRGSSGRFRGAVTLWMSVRVRSLGDEPVTPVTLNAPSLPDKPSIAVLPFENMSGDPEQEYFADGMVEEIITALSRLRWLFVIARNSSFAYKGRAVDVRQIGRELGVRYVLEGSVRKSGNTVRISGQLIDTATGAHLWAEHFDGGLEDIFVLQDQVTASVVGAIGPKLEQAEIERAKRKPTASLDAYDYYLRGIACVHQVEQGGQQRGIVAFLPGHRTRPDFASAYGMAARCYVQRTGRRLGDRSSARDRRS